MFDLPDFGIEASFGLFFFINFFRGLQKYLENVYFIFSRDHNACDIKLHVVYTWGQFNPFTFNSTGLWSKSGNGFMLKY